VLATATPPRGRLPRFVALLALTTVLVAVVLVVLTPTGSPDRHPRAARVSRPHAAVHRRRPYWIVRPGDTFGLISQKTGLTVAQLEAFNHHTSPLSLVPGQRLNLWRHPPAPRREPPGPRFWRVRTGDSFGSIAAKTGINLDRLEHLNPRLKPSTLQPGDRVRLR
jgi:LysM domain-containing protein